MAKTPLCDPHLKQVVKETLMELLAEDRDCLRDLIAEAIEDLALKEAIHQGRKTKKVARESVMDVLQGKA
jgi:DNA-binding protein YbaB